MDLYQLYLSTTLLSYYASRLSINIEQQSSRGLKQNWTNGGCLSYNVCLSYLLLLFYFWPILLGENRLKFNCYIFIKFYDSCLLPYRQFISIKPEFKTFVFSSWFILGWAEQGCQLFFLLGCQLLLSRMLFETSGAQFFRTPGGILSRDGTLLITWQLVRTYRALSRLIRPDKASCVPTNEIQSMFFFHRMTTFIPETNPDSSRLILTHLNCSKHHFQKW